MKKNLTLILFLMLSMAMVNQCFAQTHNTLDLEVTQISNYTNYNRRCGDIKNHAQPG